MNKGMGPAADFSELIRQCGEKAYNFAYRLAGNERAMQDHIVSGVHASANLGRGHDVWD